MDIRVLQYFLTVAREQNITKAADALHMTQPPLSRQLMELEEELGTKLFIRGNKKITLTDDGLLLKSRAEEILSLFEKTKAEITHADENIRGEITIGCGETNAVSLLAKTARELSHQYPDIHYSTFSGDADRIFEKLDKGLIDFGLLIGNVDIERYDYLKLPVSDTWGVLLRRDDPLAEKDSITAEDLQKKPLIVSHQSADNSEMRAWLKESQMRMNVVMKYDLLYNASHFVEHGFGYAIVLDKIVSTTGERSLCFRSLKPELKAEIRLIWKKHQILSDAARLFLNEIEKLT